MAALGGEGELDLGVSAHDLVVRALQSQLDGRRVPHRNEGEASRPARLPVALHLGRLDRSEAGEVGGQHVLVCVKVEAPYKEPATRICRGCGDGDDRRRPRGPLPMHGASELVRGWLHGDGVLVMLVGMVGVGCCCCDWALRSRRRKRRRRIVGCVVLMRLQLERRGCRICVGGCRCAGRHYASSVALDCRMSGRLQPTQSGCPVPRWRGCSRHPVRTIHHRIAGAATVWGWGVLCCGWICRIGRRGRCVASSGVEVVGVAWGSMVSAIVGMWGPAWLEDAPCVRNGAIPGLLRSRARHNRRWRRLSGHRLLDIHRSSVHDGGSVGESRVHPAAVDESHERESSTAA
jgi:hypothetical protein